MLVHNYNNTQSVCLYFFIQEMSVRKVMEDVNKSVMTLPHLLSVVAGKAMS